MTKTIPVLLFYTLLAPAQSMNTYQFDEVSYVQKLPPDFCNVGVTIHQVGSDMRLSTSFQCKQLDVLVKLWGLKDYEQLQGRAFQSQVADPGSAVRDLAFHSGYQQRHGRPYAPPAPAQIDEMVVSAFSRLEEPNFDEIDLDTKRAYVRSIMFGSFDIQADWVRRVQTQLDRSGSNQVKLVPAQKADVNIGLKTPAAYLYLRRGATEKLVYIVPLDGGVSIYKGTYDYRQKK